MRTISSLGHYVATVAGDVLYLHHLAESRVSGPLAGDFVSLDVATRYPWSGSAEMRVHRSPAAEFGLAVRIPGWSRVVSVRLNGEPPAPDTDGRGYLLIRRLWQPGDVI